MSSAVADYSLSKSIDAKLEEHRKKLAKHKEWLQSESQRSTSPKKSNSSDNAPFNVDLSTQRKIKNIDDGESVEAIITKLKLNASAVISDSEDEDNDDDGSLTSRSGSRRGEAIEEKLIQKGKEMEDKKEQLRDRFLTEVNSFQPNISDASRRFGGNNSSNIMERFEEKERLRRDNIENQRQESSEELSFKPAISKLGQSIRGREDVNEVNRIWERERDEKLNRLREIKEEKEMVEEVFKPKLNPRTLKIINKKKAKGGNMSLEESFERKEFLRQQRVLEMTEDYFGNVAPMTPKITAQAAKMMRDGSVSDRLYQLSFKMNEKKQEISMQQIEDEKRLYDFNPKINMTDLERDETVYEDLFQKEEHFRMKRYERLEKLLERENLLHFPKINPVSEEIASRLPVSSKERLLVKPDKKISPSKLNLSFKPQINEKSKMIDEEKPKSAENRIAQLLNFEKKKKQSIEEKRREQDDKEMEECTFRPAIVSSVPPKNAQKSFSDRVSTWDHKRKARVERERREKSLQEMKECTFKPAIDRITKPEDVSKIGDESSDPVGFEDFVQRQVDAREKKKNAIREIKYGENWKNEITVPKEFIFNQKTALIKSLRKPMTPQTSKILESEESDRLEQSFNDIYDQNLSNLDSSDFLPQGMFSTRSTHGFLEVASIPQPSPSALKLEDIAESDDHFDDMTSPSGEWLKRSMFKE